SYQNLLAWTWQKSDQRFLIVINFGGVAAQGRVRLPWINLKGESWRLEDSLSTVHYDRSGDEMQESGLYVELPPWGYNCFSLTSVAEVVSAGSTEPDPAAA